MLNNFRPSTIENIIGQSELKKKLNVAIESAKTRRDCLRHSLFTGGPGLGKTTISQAIANDMNVDIQIANGGKLRSIKYLLPYLAKITKHSIFFVDEIHRMTMAVEEFLYPVMEDFRADIGSEEVMVLNLPDFTLIGATTNQGNLSPPFSDRFLDKYRIDYYKDEELVQLIKINSEKLQLNMIGDSLITLAKACKSTPRIANARLSFLRDYCVTKNIHDVTEEIVEQSLGLELISLNGLEEDDRNYLKVLQKAKKPLGLKTISALIGTPEEDILNNIEPYLLRSRMIERTPKGRIIK